MRTAFCLLFLAFQFAPGVATAQTAAERAADFAKFCKGVEPGGGRVIECLDKHLDELTPQCQKVVKAHAPG